MSIGLVKFLKENDSWFLIVLSKSGKIVLNIDIDELIIDDMMYDYISKYRGKEIVTTDGKKLIV